MSSELNKGLKKQLGLTMMSTIIVVVFLLFQVVIAMNVIPVYMTDSNVKSMMERLSTDPKAKGVSAKELKLLVIKRLGINSIYSVKPEHIHVKKGRDGKIATIEYEPRGKLIGNLEYIVSFKHEAKVSGR